MLINQKINSISSLKVKSGKLAVKVKIDKKGRHTKSQTRQEKKKRIA